MHTDVIYHQDCLTGVAENVDDASVQLVLTDPPYNIASEGGVTKQGSKVISTKKAWGSEEGYRDSFSSEEYAEFIFNIATQCDRVLTEDGSIVIFFDRGHPEYLIPFYQMFKFRNMLCFVKNNPIPHIRKNNYRSSFELAAWFSRETYKFNFLSQREMCNVFEGSLGSAFKHTEHPTEKYEWMIKPIIDRHSDRGDVVLDFFSGSGTISACSWLADRKYISFEIKKEYYDISKNRLDTLKSNTPLKSQGLNLQF